MRPGIHVGIDAQRHRRDLPHRDGDRGDRLYLFRALYVDLPDALADREPDLRRRLADTGKHNPISRDPRYAGALQLAPAHNVDARARSRHHAQHGEVIAGLYRVMQPHRHACRVERIPQRGHPHPQHVRGIYPCGRA